MDNQRILLTKDGLKSLKQEYEDLVKNKRPAAVKRLADAKAMGDLSENSEYNAAVEELSFIDGRTSELDEIIKKAKTVSSNKMHKSVDVGCQVTVQINGKHDKFRIVGEWEADPRQKKISHNSPIGKALMGKKKGEIVEAEAPVGKVVYTIVDIQ